MIRKRNQTHLLAQQKDLTEWFTAETGHSINQGMISKILSKTYDYLDDVHTKRDLKALKNKSRVSAGDWPDLEAALFEWQQRMEHKKAIITGDILKAKAKELWDALPQYENVEQPKWSNEWLDGFKKRFKIKEYVQHRESGSVATDNPDNITQIENVRRLCTEYDKCDILNIDKTGLN